MSVRVAVIGGGQNCEHEVSLASAAAVADALATVRTFGAPAYDVVRLTIGTDGMWRERNARPIGLAGAVHVLRSCDVVLPVVHGPRGEDGTLAGLCQLAGVPCVGSGLGAGALAMDKWVTKLVAAALGIGTARGDVLTAATAPSYAWTHPVVVKPVAAGSSHGVSLVTHADDLQQALVVAFAFDDRVLVEDVVIGREIDIAVLGRPDGSRLVSPPLEVVVDGIFDSTRKYDGTADFRLPAELDSAWSTSVERCAVGIYDALGCAGLARVDFFLTTAGPVLNEVNTMPGMTEHSQAPRMLAAAGLPYASMLDMLVRDVLEAA